MTLAYVVCGEPGVGKSRVARRIAERTGARRLATDEIRKRLFGPEPEYTSEESQAVYDTMFDMAHFELYTSGMVVLDATFMLKRGRDRAARLCDNVRFIRVTAKPEVVEQRIRARSADGDSSSDADVSVYHSIRDRFEPLEREHITIDNTGEWNETIKSIADIL